MSFAIPLAIAGLSGLAGALGNRKSTQVQDSTKSGTTTTTPNFGQYGGELQNQVILNYLQQLRGGGPDLTGYEAGQTQDINKLRLLQQQKNREMLAAHGIFGPAAELSNSNIDNQRFNDITALHQQIPLLKYNLQSDILNNAGKFFAASPFGQTTTTNEKTTGTATQPGNVLGGAVGGGASALAYLYGQGAFGGQKTNNPLTSSNPIYNVP